MVSTDFCLVLLVWEKVSKVVSTSFCSVLLVWERASNVVSTDFCSVLLVCCFVLPVVILTVEIL